MGVYNGLWGIGSLAGMLSGGLLADVAGLPVICAAFAVLSLTGIPLALRCVPTGSWNGSAFSGTGGSEENDGPRGRRWTGDALRVLVSAGLVSVVFFGMFASTLSRYIGEHHASSISLGGWMLGAASLTGILQAVRWAMNPVLAPWIGRHSDRKGNRVPSFVVSLLFAAAAFALAPFGPPFVLWLALLLALMLGNTLVMTLMDAIAGDTAARRGAVSFMTAYSLAVDVGAAVGPIISYSVISRFGVNAVFVMAGVLLAVVGLLWIIHYFRERRLTPLEA